LIEKIRAQFDFTIIWYDINNKITSINELSDNLVIVTVKELYSYLTDIEGTTDKSMAKYVIDYTLIKKNGSWYIYNISSCDEFDTMYFNMELDVEALLKKLDNEIDLTPRPSGKSDLEYIREQNELNAPSVKGSWYTTSFTRSYASSYASNYWEEDSYNDNFYNYSADCQNFASQCIWYAFGGINTAASIESRVVPMMYNTTDSRDWYQCDGYGECDATYRWVNCDNFAEYIDTSFYKSGPRGWYNSDGYFNYCAISDMVQLEDTGQTGDYIHTYIVNNINGTWGSMTRSNIWVSAHTNDRYNCNLATDPVLSTITDSRLRVIRIVGCNYYE
jgi:hypothetical protein